MTLATDNAIARNATISNYELPVLMQNSPFFVEVGIEVVVRLSVSRPCQNLHEYVVKIELHFPPTMF